MEAPPYTDSILLQANRKSSAEYIAGNTETKSSWVNDLGSGVKLDIGDTISVHSAYISEIGNEDSTIEIKGRNAINNLGQKQTYTTKNVTYVKTEAKPNNGGTTFLLETKDGNYGYDFTEETNTHPIRDDTIYLTHSYYKCAQGDNYISLPRAWGANDRRGWWDGASDWSASNTSLTGAIHSANPYRLGTDYSFVRTFGNHANGYGYSVSEDLIGDTRTEISNDGKRYTLFVRKSFKNYVPKGEKTQFYLQGERDPAMMDFIWYRKTVKYEVTNGFNSPANVATQVTNKMNDIDEIQNVSYGEDNDPATDSRRDGQLKQNNLNVKAISNTFETFPCSTAWFIRNAGELWFNESYSNDFKVPYFFSGAGDFLLYHSQNHFPLLEYAGGTLDGTTYRSARMFEDGHIKTGWRFKEARTSVGGGLLHQFNALKGSEICGIRDAHTDNEGTYCKMSKELSIAHEELIRDPGAGHYFYWNMSNEELPMYYESCYSTVGYLRPEIQEYGRELKSKFSSNTSTFDSLTIDGSYSVSEMTYPMENHVQPLGQPGAPSTIFTKILWNQDNLTKLKNLFEAQGLYPELFDWDGMSASQQELINVTENSPKENVSVDKMRFLHMNDNTQPDGNYSSTNITSAPTDTDVGQSIPVDSTTELLKGMRVINTNKDTSSARLFPEDTFIVKIDTTNNLIYLSNPLNDPGGLIYPFIISFAKGGLGSDKYSNASDVVSASHTAGAVFFDYNPARKDILEGEGAGSDPYETLTYGFAKKVTYFDIEYIGFYVGKYQDGTLPQIWFDEQVPPTINQNRCIGFDKHFNAYGTCAILLSNGFASLWGAPYSASGVDYNNATNSWGNPATPVASLNPVGYPDLPPMYKVFTSQPAFDGWFFHNASAERYGPTPDHPTTARIFNEIYCGATQPSLSFSGDSSRFSFQNFHTPELKGTDVEELQTATDVGGGNTPCFKINKRLSRTNYSPNFTPYNNVFKIYTASNYSASETIAEKDNNITPYAIMDSQAGIFIEDYGCDKANWSQSLWELLGFTYEQFHNEGSRLQRFNNTGLKTSTPTTNALIKTEDVQTFVKQSKSDISIFNTLELNYPSWRYDSENGAGATHWSNKANPKYEAFPGFQSYPAVTQVGVESTSIIAENLPRKMLSPIYLIKSDLLNPTYIGGREGTSNLPVIAVVDKSAGYGDYFNGATDSTIFTNTIPRTIQNIKTSIVDADGSESRVDDSSCVIYKITKQIRNNSVVLQNILYPPKK